MLSFKDCTLAQLEHTFGLEQVPSLPCLDAWVAGEASLADFERQVVLTLQEHLQLNVHDWNETELAYNFIGPMMTFVNYRTKQFNFFAERLFGGVVDGIELGGKPDGMIASGFREPKTPYFFLQEYKKDKDPEGDPAGQVLAAMLVAQELNGHQAPVYGCYVKGRDWFFLTLQGKQYAISEPYIATRAEVFDIFRILKALKPIIATLVAQGQALR